MSARRMIDIDVTDLPDPLSPTTAVVRPARTVKLSLLMTWELPKRTDRFSTRNSSSVADEVIAILRMWQPPGQPDCMLRRACVARCPDSTIPLPECEPDRRYRAAVFRGAGHSDGKLQSRLR